MDRELFYPIPGSADEETARNICHTCAIKNDCLDWALASTGFDTEHGIWGATTYEDRDRIRRGILRRQCPICKGRQLVLDGADQICVACGISWPAVRGAQPNTEADALR